MTVDPLVLLCAVRYALGRRSYAVSVVARTVVAHADALSPSLRDALARDIREALHEGRAGDQSDAGEWRAVLDALGRAALEWGAALGRAAVDGDADVS